MMAGYIRTNDLASVDNAITRWDGTSATFVQTSPLLLDDAGNVTLPVASSAALNLYVSVVNGNDASNGLTPGTAVRTTAGLAKVFPRIRAQPVVVHLDSGNHVDLAVPASTPIARPCPVYFISDGAGQPGDNGFVTFASGVVGAASTDLVINVAVGAINAWQGNTLRFTSGALAGPMRRSVGSNTTTTLTPAWRLPAAPAPGDTFNIERAGAVITYTGSYTFAENVGAGQVDSPLVLVNVLSAGPLRAAQTPSHVIRISKCHVVMYGCGTIQGGSWQLVESYCNAGTLYSWGSQQQRRVGNVPPLGNGTASTVATNALADLGTDPYNYQGWGAQSPWVTNQQTCPILFDRGAFNGCYCGGFMAISSGSMAVLTGGSVVGNNIGGSGSITLETDAYCYVQGTAVQRLSALTAQNAPGNPFRLDGATLVLNLFQGSFLQLDDLSATSAVGTSSPAVSNEGGTIYMGGNVMGGTGAIALALTAAAPGNGILCMRGGSLRGFGGSLSITYSSAVANALEVTSGGYIFGLDTFTTNGNVTLGAGCKVAGAQGVAQTWSMRALNMAGRSEIDFSQSAVSSITFTAGAAVQCMQLDQGARLVGNNVRLVCSGFVTLQEGSELHLSGDIGATNITSSVSQALRIGSGCQVNLTGVTAGTFTCTSGVGATGVRCQGAFSFINARVAINGATTGIDFSLGGRVYSALQPTNVIGGTQDFLDEQGGFNDGLLAGATTCVFTGQHAAGAYVLAAPSGSGFVQRTT